MQWDVEVPFSSSSSNRTSRFSFILLIMTWLFNVIHFPSSVQSLSISSCSPYFFVINLDLRTKHQYIQPCPIDRPCQCLCEMESKRLWIDCFYRQLKQFPQLQTIPTNDTIIDWNIDLAFNSFENFDRINATTWIPTNMHIRHMVLSNTLAYDLIVQLNLTHRHLIDSWPSQSYLGIIDDQYQLFDQYVNDQSEEEEEDFDRLKSRSNSSTSEYTRLLNKLTSKLRGESRRINDFTLSLAGEPAPISNLYLDHNSLQTIPSQALYNATGLYEIYFSFNNLTYLPAYAFGFSHRLTRVDLSYNQIVSMDNLTFQRHPDAFAGPFLIDYLDLSHNQLFLLESDVFSYLVNLRILKLEHNHIYSISGHTWTGLYRLKYLDLSHNSIENITQVFYSGYLNELNHLKITSNNLTELGPCEFLSLKSLSKLNLNGNNITLIDSCSFHGLQHGSYPTSPNVYLRSNQLETIDPCVFRNFARSTIHLANNPLICNCSLNYLLQYRQSLAYTGQECRRGFVYQTRNQQLTQPAVRKSNMTLAKKPPLNVSQTCQETYNYYNELCSKIDCNDQCATNELLIIQITTIPTPSGRKSLYDETNSFSMIIILVLIHSPFLV